MAIERLVPGTIEWEAYYANHISRYQFASEQLKDKEIKNLLDAACGVGYGSAYLSIKLENVNVYGIDKSIEALAVAKKNFQNTHVNFLEDDCQTLANVSSCGPFDAIVSFETLEHLPQPDQFLKSCKSNLKQGGFFIVSTPNQPVTSPGGVQWEFHEKEYTVSELTELLERTGFYSIKIFGQRFTPIGKLRHQIRREFNRVHSNPFARIGSYIQKVTRGVKFAAILPEQPEDIEIVYYPDHKIISDENVNGPFVLIAVCRS